MSQAAPPHPRRPKVCHIIHFDGPGGGPMVVIDQLRAFAEDFELGVIHGGSGMIAEYCEQQGIPHWRVSIERLSSLPIGFFGTLLCLRRWRPDAVILHGQWGGPVGALASFVAGIRRILYVAHWPAFYTDWDLFRTVRNRLVEVIPCRFATRVVTLSRGNQYQYLLRRLVDPAKLVLIPNSIHASRVPSALEMAEHRKRLGWDDAQIHVVSVGRLADQKRLDWLLRSWRIVLQRAPQARLWIVGDGPERVALEKLAGELGLGDACVFLGPRTDGITWIGAADVIAMTTIYEAFGVVAIEAMACGKPIVASRVDGVSDTVRDGLDGFLVPPGDVELFGERLLRLIEDAELRKTMGARGLERAGEFSPQGIMKKYRAVMDELLAPEK